MKIGFQNNSYYINPYKNIYFKKADISRDVVSFKSTVQVPQSAVKYLNARKEYFSKFNFDLFDLSLFDSKKLEGIQNGIDVFKGLNFKQIAFFIERLKGINVQRGCNNACIHCFADAQTPFHMKANNLTDKIDFEDYENLINGLNELNKRLGFNVFPPSRYVYKALFHDADCSMISLQDKNGKMYDYADLAKMFFDISENIIIFDTSGWNINDIKTQKRMEDLVKKVVNNNEYSFIKFNISINPFHSIYNKSVELAKKGDVETAKKFREIYTTRMANVIYTLSPLIKKINSITEEPSLRFILRSLYNPTELYGYRENDLRRLCHEIAGKLEKMYDNDLASNTNKVVKNRGEKSDYLFYIQRFLINPHAGSINLCNKKLTEKLEDIPAAEYSTVAKYSHNSAEAGKLFDYGFVDVNGKFYVTNFIETYPTDIVLNYKTKDQPTAPIAPNLRDKIITLG